MIRLYEYSLPFKSPFKSAAKSYDYRNGILINLKSKSHSLWSESSPLPGFSPESISQVKKALLHNTTEISNFFQEDFNIDDLNLYLENYPSLPSVRFSLSYLGLLLLAQRKSVSTVKILGVPDIHEIYVNDIIGAGAVTDIKKKIQSGSKKGFSTFKIKAPFPVNDLAEALRAACEEYPHIKIRLDANQTWPEKKLADIGHSFASLPVEYIEEPIVLENPDQIREVSTKLSIPVALDESIKDMKGLKRLLKSGPDVFIIVKPMILGNLFKIHETISKYRSNQNNIVVTTSLESAIGRTMITNVAAAIGDRKLAHGLNTGQFFSTDLVNQSAQMNGIIKYSEWNRTTTLTEINQSLIKPLH